MKWCVLFLCALIWAASMVPITSFEAVPPCTGACADKASRTALKEMADNLAPSKQLQTEVERIIDSLIQHLRDLKFTWSHAIDRIVPLGSFAKKTSLRIIMDLDLVVFLNDLEYPFDGFLGELEDHIQQKDSYQNCSRSGMRLVFIAEGTLHVDLLAATNRVPKDSQGQSSRELQHTNTLRSIQNSEDPFNAGLEQSTALSETAVEFVKRKNEQYHASTIARLAKFWCKTVCVKDFHAERSSIMEYVAIRAAEMEQSDGRENTFQTFRRFLSLMSNPGDMMIYWTDYYDERDIDPEMMRQRPLLLDPTNPYNNLLGGRNREHIEEIARFAEVSLNRLNEEEARARQGEHLNMSTLFEPQPDWRGLPFNVGPSRKPTRVSVSVEDSCSLMMPRTTFNPQNVNSRDVEIIENFLFSFFEVSVVTAKRMGVDVAEQVERDAHDMLGPIASWGCGGKPEDPDVNLEIPFSDENDRNRVLKIGLNME